MVRSVSISRECSHCDQRSLYDEELMSERATHAEIIMMWYSTCLVMGLGLWWVEWEFQSHHIRVEFTPMMGIPPIRVNGNSKGLWWVTWEFHPSDSRMASLELEVVSSIAYFLDWSRRINRKEILLPNLTRWKHGKHCAGFEFGLNVFGGGQLTVPAVTYVSPAKTANHIPH